MDHWSKSSDAFASALKEVDDIMKHNEIMLANLGNEETLTAAGCREPNYLTSSNSASHGSYTTGSSVKFDSKTGSKGDEAASAVLLSELRSCVSEVSDVREVFRNLSSDKQLFLDALVNENPNISSFGKTDSSNYSQALADLQKELGKFCTSNHLPHTTSTTDARPTWSMSAAGSGGPTMGVGAIHLDRLAALEDEKKSLVDEVAFLKGEVEVYRNKCKNMEYYTHSEQETSEENKERQYQCLVDENAQLKLQINTLEHEKKELRQKIIYQRSEIEELNLRLIQQESDLTEAKLSTFENAYNNEESSHPEVADSFDALNDGSSPVENSCDSPSDIQSWQQTNSMEELRICPGLVAVIPPLTPPIKSRFVVSSCVRSNSLPASKIISRKFDPRLVDRLCGQMMDLSDFESWDSNRLVVWLHKLNLECYTKPLLKWVLSGKQLLNASKKQLEKGLGIRNSLHLKKLLIYLRAARTYPSTGPLFMKLIPNSFSIQKWLDDIGLLPYLSLFQMVAIDANVLNQLTLEDLLSMKISNELHICSIRRGIQVLRYIQFDLDQLIRRPPVVVNETSASNPSIISDDAADKDIKLMESTKDVALWSHHRVMEWLRDIELPEYASNLRGSGVHGALLMLEDRFNSELFASILNISADKSLLRRHLSLHFHTLVGETVHCRKRDCESQCDATPLTATSKIKLMRKRPNFFPRKRKNSQIDQDELLCTPDSECNIRCL